MERIWDRMKEKAKVMFGTLGWLILGIVLMRNEIGPWWVGWTALMVSSITMLLRMGSIVNQKEDWEI